MLYDPRWEEKANPTFEGVSLLPLIAWLETQPAEQTYDFINPMHCALAQYKASLGCHGLRQMVDFGGPLDPPDDGHWLQEIIGTRPFTFGAALARARTEAFGGHR